MFIENREPTVRNESVAQYRIFKFNVLWTNLNLEVFYRGLFCGGDDRGKLWVFVFCKAFL